MQLEDGVDRTMATEQLSSEEEWEMGVGPVGVKDWRAPDLHRSSRGKGYGGGVWERRKKLEGRTYQRQVAASCVHEVGPRAASTISHGDANTNEGCTSSVAAS